MEAVASTLVQHVGHGDGEAGHGIKELLYFQAEDSRTRDIKTITFNI